MVHRGEVVQFDFVLQDARKRRVDPTGVADYCVAFIGNERIECEPDLYGHFSFSFRFDQMRPGARIPVRANAYTLRGSRDYMKVAGDWMRNESPYEMPDRKGPGASLTLTVYEAPIELAIPSKRLPLDPETAVLRIHKNDGSVTAVFPHRPHRPGFLFDGPTDAGIYNVRYLPQGNELNSYGTTKISFLIYDVAGQSYRVESELDTP